MRITIIASGAGEKALYLYEFFKGGNRVTFDSLLTDNTASPVAIAMAEELVEVIPLPEGDGAELAETLRNRGVELLVIDGFSGEIPEKLAETYSDRTVTLTSREKAPLEVIEAIGKVVASYAPVQPEAQSEDTQEKEWADALKIDMEPNASPASGGQESEVNPGAPEGPALSEQQGQPYQQQEPSPQQPYQPQQPQQAPYQPRYFQPSEPMPPTHLVWSVILTLVCCTIPGIVAIIFSSMVSSRYYKGNYEGARRASRMAEIWCIVSVVAGILWATLYLPLSLLL